jgi:malonyl-CoA O-methyltransferase
MMNDKTEIGNAFNAHASDYVKAAKVQREIGDRLFERLDWIKLKPRYILDLGCGPGTFSRQLKKRYPDALVIGLDLAHAMLREAKSLQGWRCKWGLVHADMTRLPFASGLFDLVFANQVIHWANPLSDVIREINRVMAPNGCLMFTMPGPDTFKEIRQSFASADQHAHVNHFPDMHDVGDCLMSEYFQDPVMDMEMLTVHYPGLLPLLHALKSQGVRNINSNRNPGLTGKQSWRKFEESMARYCTPEGKYPLTYEVVYGHAWKGSQSRTGQGVETMVSVDALRATLKKSV